MTKIKFECNDGDDCVYEIEDDLVDKNIEAELETAKYEYMRNGIHYDYIDGVDSDGCPYTEIWECGGDRYTRWTVLNNQ